MDNILTGARLGPYMIGNLIARGGMGEVYEATTPQGERVAIKVLRGDNDGLLPEGVDRFVREVRLMESLTHPHIVTIYDYGHTDDMLYFTMEYIPGPNLNKLMSEHPLSIQDAWLLLVQVMEGLIYGHQQGIMHRDIKPDNILLKSTEAGWHVYIADFGIGKKPGVDKTLTEVGSIIGTPTYMSPEAVLGERLDNRADVYSTAVLAYHMMLGQPPHKETHAHLTAMAHATKPIPLPSLLNPYFPSALEAVLLRALQRDREERYQTMQDFKNALQDAIEGLEDEDRTRTYSS